MMRCVKTCFAVALIIAQVNHVHGQDAAIEDLLSQATSAAERGEHDKAIARLTEVIEKSPATTMAWYLRGREHFRAGKIAEAVADFDKYVQLVPQAEARQWERGIAYYYAGQFDKGAKQFELYQSFHDQDVENSAWRYLCVDRSDSVEKAQSNMLPIAHDSRIPMMQIYDLYRGKSSPDEVIAAATKVTSKDSRNLALFYAHLYVGLWHEVGGRKSEAKTNILEAERHKIAHYMWDVAHVHADRLRAAEKN